MDVALNIEFTNAAAMGGDGAMQAQPLDWCKASLCQNGECVWVANQNGSVIMRGSQPGSAWLYFTPEEFGTFLSDAKVGAYDQPR